MAATDRQLNCVECGVRYVGHYNSKTCGSECGRRRTRRSLDAASRKFRDGPKYRARMLRLADPYPCRECGTKFVRSNPNTRYCSDECRRRWGKCEGCGARYLRDRKARFRKFCSRACGYDAKFPNGSLLPIKDGYVLIKVPADTPGTKRTRRWMFEHRYVMQQVLGRPLTAADEVHHKNGKRDDNRPENLELWRRKSQPSGVRASDYHCIGCRCHDLEGATDGGDD